MGNHTIAAISSPDGFGGIGIIRISGENAKIIADQVFKAKNGKSLKAFKGYTAALGDISGDNGKIDEAIALVFTAPKSYTGENLVELSVHGGRETTKQTLRAVISAGATLALPGEFTKRAFLNGKMDLSQAEAVSAIIAADSSRALCAARSAKDGRTTMEILKIRDLLLLSAASLAVFSDYPDEEPEFSGVDETLQRLISARDSLSILIKNYDSGRVLRQGIKTAIVGSPNTGKSTLMNQLLGNERSIVTSIAGTTRDIIEETVDIDGLKLCLSDTAGLRETDDIIEKIGVDRSRGAMETSDLIIAVFDATNINTSDNSKLLETISAHRSIAVINKADLVHEPNVSEFKMLGIPFCVISAKSGEGIDDLKSLLWQITDAANLSPDAAVFPSERSYSCAVLAKQAVCDAIETMNSGMTLDAVGVMIDDALVSLFEITGERVTDEVANEIFRKFCVGK